MNFESTDAIDKTSTERKSPAFASKGYSIWYVHNAPLLKLDTASEEGFIVTSAPSLSGLSKYYPHHDSFGQTWYCIYFKYCASKEQKSTFPTHELSLQQVPCV